MARAPTLHVRCQSSREETGVIELSQWELVGRPPFLVHCHSAFMVLSKSTAAAVERHRDSKGAWKIQVFRQFIGG